MKFSAATKKTLKHYVYGLVDPTEDDKIFYIGVASANNRAFNHLALTKARTHKATKIKEIRKAGSEPRVDILRHGLPTRKTALEVEAALIDAFGLEELVNEKRGYEVARGRKSAEELERAYGCKPVFVSDVRKPCMLFFVNRTYSPTSTEQAKYDSIRQFWSRVSEHTRTPPFPYKIALGIVEGVVVRAYTIEGWFPAGSTLSSRDWGGPIGVDKRWEFVGRQLYDHPLLDRLLVDDAGDPIRANQIGYGYLPRP